MGPPRSTPLSKIHAAVAEQIALPFQRMQKDTCPVCGGSLMVQDTKKEGLLKRVPIEWKCKSCNERIFAHERQMLLKDPQEVSQQELSRFCRVPEFVEISL